MKSHKLYFPGNNIRTKHIFPISSIILFILCSTKNNFFDARSLILLSIIYDFILFKIKWRPFKSLYTEVQNKPDSTNHAKVIWCKSYFKKNFYTILEPYEILMVILGLQLCLNYILSEISQCIKYTRMTRSKI